jgi:hypothetical protein
MQHLCEGLNAIKGGLVYQAKPTVFVLSQGDQLELPNFTIAYPQADGLSSRYVINGKTVYCKPTKEDNIWSIPSPISDSFCSRNTIIIHTDGTYLYIENHQPLAVSA